MLPYSPDQRPVNQWGKCCKKNVNFSCFFHAFSILLQEPHLNCIFIPAVLRAAEQAMAGHSSTSGQKEVQQTNEPLRQKKDPQRNNQDPSEERVEMQRFTWRIHASRRNKMMCFFHIYSILFSTDDKIYIWWRPQIMWRKLVFPCVFCAFEWKK